MKVCCLSDLHGYLPEVPDCDLLLLGGDYCGDHRDEYFYSLAFSDWLQDLKNKGVTVIGVAGNHDFIFEKNRKFAESLPWIYLQDSGTSFNGLNVYGSPHQPRYFDWAFNLDEPELAVKWDLIPDNTDILLLHGPPHGISDFSPYGQEHTGSPSLLNRILEIKPKLVVCGHIHSGNGIYKLDYGGILVNAALCDESYRPTQKIHVVEL